MPDYGAWKEESGDKAGPYGSDSPAHGNVFIGAMAPHIGQPDLMQAFEPYGEIISCKLMAAGASGRGSAFVEFMNPADAAKAIANLNGHEGWVVRLADKSRQKGGKKGGEKGGPKGGGKGKPAAGEKSPNLFIRGLPSPQAEEPALCKLFEDLGHTVVWTKILPDTTQKGSSAAMIELASADQAEAAISSLSGTTPDSMPDCKLDLSFRTTKAQTPQAATTPAATMGAPSGGEALTVKYAGSDPSIASSKLYLTGLPNPPPSTEDLNSVFESLGFKVTRSRVIPDTHGWGNSAAMVQLEDEGQAAYAIEMLNGEMWPNDIAPSKPAGGGGGGMALTVKYAGQDPSIPSDNLFITGLPVPPPSQESITAVFEGLGYTIVRSKIIPDTRGHGNTAAMVKLASQEEADAAIVTLNGEVWPQEAEAPAATQAAAMWPEEEDLVPTAKKAALPTKRSKPAVTNGHSVPMDTSEALSEALPKLASACGRKWTELAAVATRLEEKHWMYTMADLQGLSEHDWIQLDLPVKLKVLLRSQLGE